MISASQIAFILAMFAAAALGTVPSPIAKPCPYRWSRLRATDECYRAWPNKYWNVSTKVRMTHSEAVEFCATQDAELPVVRNSTQLQFILDVVGRKSGTQTWLDIRADPAIKKLPQIWRTKSGHPFTEYFEWDKRRMMPGPENCVAVQAGGDLSRRIVGGNNKMITVDCHERLSVVCVKQRVKVGIDGVNDTASGIIQQVWKTPLHLRFIGRRIPKGTLVTLQTTSESNFATAPPKYPTNCSFIRPLFGDSISMPLNVSTLTYKHRLCNGTCDVASAVWPASTPFVRGARYSFCFFVPIPFPKPMDRREYGLNLLPEIFLEIVQARREYLNDVCTRHQESVDHFLGSKRNDRGRPIVRPYYFDSPIGQ